MSEKVTLEFYDISQRLHAIKLPEVDVVIGIARGGLLPASLVAHQIQRPLHLMRLNYRDDNNKSQEDTEDAFHRCPSSRCVRWRRIYALYAQKGRAVVGQLVIVEVRITKPSWRQSGRATLPPTHYAGAHSYTSSS